MSTAPSQESSSSSDYRARFLTILNNQGKYPDEHTTSGSSDLPFRKHGFVVIVRGGSNLEPIESLCSEQTYNDCFTARYRLQPSAAIGTLVTAFLADIIRMDGDGQGIKGDLLPAGDRWKEFAKAYVNLDIGSPRFSKLMGKLQELGLRITEEEADRALASPNDAPKGQFSQEQILLQLSGLADEYALSKGQRLVLLGELSEPSTNVSEWQVALEILFRKLPERIGIVLSGAPSDFTLPENDLHFLELTLPDGEGAKSGSQAALAYKYIDSSFHRDEPARKDDLSVNDYANAIARFVLHPQTQPPLTMGIHGPWGKGKSSFMRLVDAALIKYAEVNRNEKRSEFNGETRLQRWNDLVAKLHLFETKAPGRTPDENEINTYNENKKKEAALWNTMTQEATRNIISVPFNAWQFEDAKQTWAGLASQISEVIERTLPWHSRQLLKLKYAWKERKTDLLLQLLLPLAVICLVAGLVSLGFFQNIFPPNASTILQLLLPAGSVLLTVWFVSSQLLKVVQPISERVLSYVRMPNYRDQMGFQHLVKDDLRFLYKFLISRLPGCRVVVYIDDLDRCSEEKIMEILQAINLILASCEFYVFVGMDTEMIYRAIKSHYKDNMADRFPKDYLRKIIQISFYLPKTRPEVRLEYLNTLFSVKAQQERQNQIAESAEQDAIPLVAAGDGLLHYDLDGVLPVSRLETHEVEDTADELKAFDAYSKFLDDNPREIKRLINIHRLVKILLQKQNTSWSGDRQGKLVKWLIFCDRWPDLVDDVLEITEKSKSSTNCVRELANSLSPANAELKEFADLRDALSAKDIDDDFRLAADLSQLVRKSPADTVTPPEAANTVDPLALD